MNRLGFILLSLLRASGATSRLSGMTLREIASSEDFGVEENTVFKKLKEFEQSGYVSRGLKEGRAHTYFITPEGCECLEKERSK